MIPVLLEAFKTQQKQLNDQKQLIENLFEKQGNIAGFHQISSLDAGYSMEQNIPNPYTHETLIRYTLPEEIRAAYLAIYDLSGKQVTTFEIKEKGSSSISITSEKLAAGIYIYSIIADGKIMESKRMAVAEK